MKALSELEIMEISCRTKSMAYQEKQIVVRNLPTSLLNEEIARRTEVASNKLSQVYDVLGTVTNDISLEDMQEVIKSIKQIVKVG